MSDQFVEVEIGKTYAVSNRRKKSFFETSNLENDDGQSVSREMLWRQGTFLVTPVNQAEVDLLMVAQEEHYESTVPMDFFEDTEFDSTWDGISEDFYSDDVEDILDLQDKYCEDDDLLEQYFSFEEYLEETRGFSEVDYEVFIDGSIIVEKVE